MCAMQEQKHPEERNSMIGLGFWFILEPNQDQKPTDYLTPLNKRIVVSRDVIFEENKEWKWNDNKGFDGFVDEDYEINLRRLSNGEHEAEGLDDDDDNDDGENNVTNHDDEYEGVDEGEGEEDHQPQPRRSTRTSNKPSYLDDYILIAEVESEKLLMIINDEPWSFVEAKEMKVWIDACKDEIHSIERNNTWDLVELPAGVKPIGLKWVFKIKRNADGTISKYKARLVAKGYVQRHT